MAPGAAASALASALAEYDAQALSLRTLSAEYRAAGLLGKHAEAARALAAVEEARGQAWKVARQHGVKPEQGEGGKAIVARDDVEAFEVDISLPPNTRAAGVSLECDGAGALVASTSDAGRELARVPLAPRVVARAAHARARMRKAKEEGDGAPTLRVHIPLLGGCTPARMSAVAAAAAASLDRLGYAVIDRFLPSAGATKLFAWAKGARAAGRLAPGEVEGGLRPDDRGDKMMWLDVAAEASSDPSVADAAAAIDALILGLITGAPASELSCLDEGIGAVDAEALLHLAMTVDKVNTAVADELKFKSLFRDKAMLTWYPPGNARYVKHIDNFNRGNSSRVLTSVLYVTPDGWGAADGGAIRLYPRRSDGEPVDIAPLANRLVLFYSDSRTPHEVLACSRDGRMALSFWYHDELRMTKDDESPPQVSPPS